MSGKKGKRDDSYFAADRRKKKKYVMIIVPIIAAVVAIGAVSALLYKPPEVQAISGVECHPSEITNYHVHAHLDVLVDGKNQTVPSNIGIMQSPHCLFWLHTHDDTGTIHVEAPQQRQFTLGQFMDIWKQTHSGSNSFFDSVAGKPLKAYVNGTEFQGDYKNIELKSRQQIVLAYGNPPDKIPTHDFGSLR
ncbi:hypothetical protein NTE_02801 [Candidatus Nitrososphaera evergladensis SR1]|uniref:Uncharacterized protein n=1 Tax=Candidatus Nitrososphaera evergladensis SR1 TaxID=1459636 RepID=A0A075MTD2_9ARCH|nr:hypothetical protein [Candidatus Nitrososphaera evergladensis]AIF84841.1 hypothetical protein NTE_02801 [Candidatus Nitrososphaera evergladensis SR1]